MTHLKYLDILLLCAGNRLNARLFGIRNLGVVMNWVIRVLILCSDGVVIHGILTNGGVTWFSVAKAFCNLPEPIVLMMYATRRSRIIGLLKKIQSSDSPSIRKSSMKWLLFTSIFIAFQVACTARMYNARTPFQLIIWMLSVFPYQMNQSLIIYPVYYMVTLKVLTEKELDHLTNICKLVGRGSRDVNRMLDDVSNMRSIKEEFERLFNLVPFFAFGIMFVSIPSYLLSISHDLNSGKTNIFQQLISFGIFHIAVCIVVLFLVHCVSHVKETVNKSISDLIRDIQRRYIRDLHNTGYQSLIDELRMDQGFVFTGCNMFVIDRFILLSFLSSIISFSVLLIQLGNSA